MRYILAALISVCAIFAQAQQINPVPDYVFGNRMSVGRTSVTDTAAYFSVGPRYGAIRGMMPPMVVDTALVSGNKRNGLLIFSVQKNKFVYWDSVGSKWAEMAGTGGTAINSGDTAAMLLPYLRKADTTAMLAPYLKESDTAFLSNRINLKVNISDTSSMLTNYVRHAGYGLTKSGQAFLVDTAAMATRARVQKGIDSVAVAGLTGSGTTNYVAKFTGTKALGNSLIQDNGLNVGVNTTPTTTKFTVSESSNSWAAAFIAPSSNEVQISGNITGNNNGPSIRGVTSGGAAYTSLTLDASYLDFKISGVSQQRIFTNGNIGIGTTTDAGYKTDIAGTLRSTLGANFATTSGNVGIGTASATSPLTVFNPTANTNILEVRGGGGSSQSRIILNYGTQTSVTAENALIFSNTSEFSLRARANRVINFYTDAGSGESEKLRITSDGELLIGTTSDAGDYKLQVNGNERIAGKLDVITTTEYGVNLGRSGTSATAFQAYNSTAAMAVGIESSTGGGLFTGTSAYAAVFGNANNYPTQFVTNNTLRATISAAGELLVGTTSDQGDYNIQTNNAIYAAGNAAGVGVLVGSDKSIETTGVNLNLNANQGGAGLSTISMKLTSATPAFTFSSDAVLMFGTNTYSTMTNGLTMKNGTAPTGSATDQFHMYSADITAGNAAPHFRTENNAVIKLYQETTGVAAAAFTANSGTAVNDASTFDGYTLKQVVKALRNLGILQ